MRISAAWAQHSEVMTWARHGPSGIRWGHRAVVACPALSVWGQHGGTRCGDVLSSVANLGTALWGGGMGTARLVWGQHGATVTWAQQVGLKDGTS